MSLKERILNTVDDLVADFVYYDRKNDEDLTLEEFRFAFSNGDITEDEIITRFKEALGELRLKEV